MNERKTKARQDSWDGMNWTQSLEWRTLTGELLTPEPEPDEWKNKCREKKMKQDEERLNLKAFPYWTSLQWKNKSISYFTGWRVKKRKEKRIDWRRKRNINESEREGLKKKKSKTFSFLNLEKPLIHEFTLPSWTVKEEERLTEPEPIYSL